MCIFGRGSKKTSPGERNVNFSKRGSKCMSVTIKKKSVALWPTLFVYKMPRQPQTGCSRWVTARREKKNTSTICHGVLPKSRILKNAKKL